MATLVNPTVDPGGTGDYTSLNSADSGYFGASGLNLVSNDEYVECECICTNGNADTSSVNISGYTTDSTHYIKIYVPDSYRHKGVFPTSGNIYRLKVGSGYRVFKSYDDYVKLHDLAAEITVAGDYNVGFHFKGKSCEAHHCLVKVVDSGSYDYSGGFYLQNNPTTSPGWHKVENCIVYGADQKSTHAAFIVAGDKVTAYIYNCTGAKCYNAVLGRDGVGVVKNFLGFGTTAGFVTTGTASFGAACTHNASDQGDAPGSNAMDLSAYSGSDIFKDYANNDLHLAPNSPVAGQGIDLSSDSDLAVTDDIDRTTRRFYFDIGADQLTRFYGSVAMPLMTVDGDLHHQLVRELSGTFSMPGLAISGSLTAGDVYTLSGSLTLASLGISGELIVPGTYDVYGVLSLPILNISGRFPGETLITPTPSRRKRLFVLRYR